MRAQGVVEADCKCYQMGMCSVFHSRHHLSISCRSRYPSWDEIAEARDRLCDPEETWIMVLRPPDEYVNVDENCFHLWSKTGIQSEWAGIVLPEQDI